MPKNFFAVVSDETAQASRSRDAGVADGSVVAVFVGSDGLARAARGVERLETLQKPALRRAIVGGAVCVLWMATFEACWVLPQLAAAAQRANKPLYVVLRMVFFPLGYLVYVRERSALPAALVQTQAPLRVHLPLSAMQWVLYGLMLKWGWRMLLGGPEKGAVDGSHSRRESSDKADGA